MQSYHFSSIYQVSIPLLSMIYALSNLASTIVLWVRHYSFPKFTGKEMEDERA